MAGGLSNSARYALPPGVTERSEKVEYATPRCLQTGREPAIVSMHSSSGTFAAAIVHKILLVSVDKMLAFTPLPMPSASTRVAPPSAAGIISTLSPQSSSFFLLSDT